MGKVETQRWSIEQRLEFIEFRLFWDGVLQRSDIMKKFSVSAPQASKDIKAYRESAPTNIEYDSSQKCFIAGETFGSKHYVPNAARYLAQIGAIESGTISVDDTLISSLISHDSLPIPSRKINANRLRKIIEAVRLKRSLSIEYLSMNPKRLGKTWREISPHSLAYDGTRWHVRALCHISKTYKDFIISRCCNIGALGNQLAGQEEDHQWNTFFDVKLIPNPDFNDHQKQVIESDYGMEGGFTTIRSRIAMLYYFDKRMRLDIPREKDRPSKTPIVVENRDAYDKALAGVYPAPAIEFVI